MKPIKVFISYHEKDEEFRQQLETHLASLRRQEVISSWHDRKIIPGQDIQGEIDQHLNQAGLILLLISPEFLDSDYHWTVEVTRALEQNAAKKACVIPVLLRYADWENPPINELSPLPKNRKPIKSWADTDEAFVDVVKGIQEVIAPLIVQLVNSSNGLPHQENTTKQEDRQYQVTSLLNAANRLSQGKNFEAAILKHQAAISLDPNSVYAHNGLGIALRKLGKLEAAIASYYKALKINPSLAYLHYNLGIALNEQGRLEEAIASYRQALKIDPNFAGAYCNLGTALKTQGRLEEAIASYRQALKIDPNFAGAYCNLGIALEAQGKPEEAIAVMEIAVSLDPTSNLFRRNLEIFKNKKKGFWGRLFST
ncbi:MAG TPA: tetratricopeptide repeat protein [Trichormus sp. M33_DOE_039]|nr:tetratricopeptide repeat protein [Trichormus sp. M33_DOE_039]